MSLHRCLALVFMVGLGTAGVARAEKVQCRDGTQGERGRGACSHHGGVAGDDEQPAATPEPPEPAVQHCKDGTTSTAVGRGACSHHGGVVDRADAPVAPAAPGTPPPRKSTTVTPSEMTDAPSARDEVDSAAPSKAGRATARCKDGTISYSTHHSGTCSHHGGVKEWF